jgi:hypothetical protein
LNVGIMVEGELRRRPGMIKQPGVFTRVGGPSRAISIPAGDTTPIVWWWGDGDAYDFPPPLLVWPFDDLLNIPNGDSQPKGTKDIVLRDIRFRIPRNARRIRVGDLICNVSLPDPVTNFNRTATITFTHPDGTPAFEAIGGVIALIWTLAPNVAGERGEIIRLGATSVGARWTFPRAFDPITEVGRFLTVDAIALDGAGVRALSNWGTDTKQIRSGIFRYFDPTMAGPEIDSTGTYPDLNGTFIDNELIPDGADFYWCRSSPSSNVADFTGGDPVWDMAASGPITVSFDMLIQPLFAETDIASTGTGKLSVELSGVGMMKLFWFDSSSGVLDQREFPVGRVSVRLEGRPKGDGTFLVDLYLDDVFFVTSNTPLGGSQCIMDSLEVQRDGSGFVAVKDLVGVR